MDDCGEGVWNSSCCAGWDGEGLEEWFDVRVGYVGLGVWDSFVVEDHAGSDSVWRPCF